MFEPEVNDRLQVLCDRLAEESPEIQALLAKLAAGEMGKLEGMMEFMTLVQTVPGMEQRIMELGEEALAPLREEDLVTTSGENVVRVEGMEVPAVVQVGPGLPGLNPLYEAALAERLQFDGDIPEARTAPLPPGFKPAVPVATTTRSMSAIGHMLETASEEVMGELANSRHQVLQMAGDLVPSTVVDDLDHLEKIKAAEPKGYRTSTPAALRRASVPTGNFLASMTPEDKREATWKALSTTQGRRSALGGITEVIAQGLANEGASLIVKTAPTGRLDSAEEVVVYEEWTVTLAGPKATQSQFSFIDTAGKALLARLVQHDLTELPPSARLDVLPINTVSVNQVGWAARIVVRG